MLIVIVPEVALAPTFKTTGTAGPGTTPYVAVAAGRQEYRISNTDFVLIPGGLIETMFGAWAFSVPRSFSDHIGSIDPNALKTPARRAEFTLTETRAFHFTLNRDRTNYHARSRQLQFQ